MGELDPIALEAAKLLPCPFCGGEAFHQNAGQQWRANSFVRCTRCGAAGNAGSHEEAIAAWNRRSPAPAGDGEVEAGLLERLEQPCALNEYGMVEMHPDVLAEIVAALRRPTSPPTPLAREAALEEAAKVADQHLARIPGHHPDQPMTDLVAQGYGNASINIAAAIRSLVASPGDGTGWQPEEAAPRDGTYVIVTVIPFDTPEPIVSAAYYRNGAHDDTDNGWWWAGESPGDYYAERIRGNVIAWQPMPEAAPLPAPDVRGGE